jgi:hypothetical protein
VENSSKLERIRPRNQGRISKPVAVLVLAHYQQVLGHPEAGEEDEEVAEYDLAVPTSRGATTGEVATPTSTLEVPPTGTTGGGVTDTVGATEAEIEVGTEGPPADTEAASNFFFSHYRSNFLNFVCFSFLS